MFLSSLLICALFSITKAGESEECTEQPFKPSIGTVIDLSEFLSGNSSTQQQIADIFDREMQNHGFIILSNHGIHDDIINSLYTAADTFFSSPSDTKIEYQLGAFGNAGYQPFGTQSNKIELTDEYSAIAADLVESFDLRNIGYNWFLTNPKCEDLPHAFKENNVLKNYVEKLGIVRSRLHYLATIALGLDTNIFEIKMISQPNESTFGSVRMNYYFELDPNGSYTNTSRLGSHTDYFGFNLLSADDICGLQFHINEEWIDFQCDRNMFIVIAGDYIEHWTNHRWIAAKHRVVRCDDEYRKRLSFSYFTAPNFEELLLPFPGCRKCAVDAKEHGNRKFTASQTYKY